MLRFIIFPCNVQDTTPKSCMRFSPNFSVYSHPNVHMTSHVSIILHTTWSALRLRMEEPAFSHGGQLRMYWIGRRGQPTMCGTKFGGWAGANYSPLWNEFLTFYTGWRTSILWSDAGTEYGEGGKALKEEIYTHFGRKPEGKRPLRRPRCK